jgi:hypothetical protein
VGREPNIIASAEATLLLRAYKQYLRKINVQENSKKGEFSMENENVLQNIDGQVLAEEAEAILSQATGGSAVSVIAPATIIGASGGAIAGNFIGQNKSVGYAGGVGIGAGGGAVAGAAISGAAVGAKKIFDNREKFQVSPVEDSPRVRGIVL